MATYDVEKKSDADVVATQAAYDDTLVTEAEGNALKRNLHGRHMQMIAVGGAIGAGLFVGSGAVLSTGGPGSLVISFLIVGVMMLCVVLALAEMAVMYPVNGAFTEYYIRFIDPSWGFAMSWNYAISWLTVLPFEITAAALTISFWHTYNIGIWIAVFLTLLALVQLFGVRGYGEVEFVLSFIKICACIGFILFGLIDVCGGVPTDDRGYIGGRYWHNPGAFNNGFHGFCSCFTNAAFAFGGTELTGLAAAESADPKKEVPRASKNVFWRILIFYVGSLLFVGLLVPSDDPNLLNASSSATKYSPFVIAIRNAGVKGLPSVFNAVITISVLSVANSATFGSTRTIQALAAKGMAPKILAYVDKKGRPVPTVILQMLFALLAFIGEAKQESLVFTWLLSLAGLSYFFIWGSICLAHLRFRHAWKVQGHSLDQLAYKSGLGIYGSWFGMIMCVLCLVAEFYYSVWPIGSAPSADYFFEQYLAAVIVIVLYIGWKVWSAAGSRDPRINYRGWSLYIRAHEMDLTTGLRQGVLDNLEYPEEEPHRRLSNADKAKAAPSKLARLFW